VNDKEAQFAFIHAHADRYPVTRLIEMSCVSRSGYYKWLKNKGQNIQDMKDESILPYILKIFNDHKKTYGRKRLKIVLWNEFQMRVNEKRISRLMRKYGLQCQIRRKRFKHKPQPHGNIPNILARNFLALKPRIKFSIDITYVDVKKGPNRWLYVCAIKDLYNQEILAYSMGTSQDIGLVFRALDELKKRGFANGAILHSDQGSQFTNQRYIERVKGMGITQSMSRRGNCWDNACIENFFGHLKSEMYHFTNPKTVHEVQEAVHDFINYYNHKRIQTKLKMSPIDYLNQVA
jgi:putative transposase